MKRFKAVFSKKDRAIGLIQALVTVAISGILVFGAAKILKFYSLSLAQLEYLGEVHDLKHTVLQTTGCKNTLRWQFDQCSGGGYIEVRDHEDAVLVNQWPAPTSFGDSLNVRAKCTHRDGVFDLDVEFRREKNGAPVKNRRTGKTSEWTPLFAGTGFSCQGSRVFVSTAYSDLGSRTAYTNACQSDAEAAGIGGKWRALMSLTKDFPIAAADSAFDTAGTLDAIDYLQLRGPTFNAAGQLIAKDELAFWNSAHAHAVNYDARNKTINAGLVRVMSGTKQGGRYDNQCWAGNGDGKGCNCRNFTRADSGGAPASGCTGTCWRTWCGRPDRSGGWLNINNPANATNCTVCINNTSSFPAQGFYCVEGDY